ncbi:MAG TPA: MFS transporter [Acidimicrobiia bacterium]
MRRTNEATLVYAAGVVQGIALVTFPAASAVFTDADEYDLSSSAYGALFVPLAAMAITSSLLGAGLTRRVGTRMLYLVGLGANLASMVLLLASTLAAGDTVAYPVLLAATACLGIGFGLTVPAINTLTAGLHPAKVDTSVLVLNALLGLGTAAAPVLVAAFVGLGFWWGLPVMSSALLVVLLGLSVGLPLRSPPLAARRDESPGDGTPEHPGVGSVPARFWVFAGFALLYGVCETMNGNWAQLYVKDDLQGSATLGSIALTTFWASVTIGRVGFALVQRQFPTRRTFHLLPFVLVAAFVVIAALPDRRPVLAVLAFALAGLGCSALLPLMITFGQEELVAIAASVAGGVIAFYQLGYGIAAFGVGPLEDAGLDLSTIYGLVAIVAAVMGGLSFLATRGHGEPVALHPRPVAAVHAFDTPSTPKTQGALP